MKKPKAVAEMIYRKYHARYQGDVQGCCLLIADEINRAVGGEVVAGEIVLMGSLRRTHWWVDLEGEILDPMGDDKLMDPRDFPERLEVHRDRATFEAILPHYEQWRVVD